MAENLRPAQKARIRRASSAAQRRMNRLDAASLRQLQQLYRLARSDIADQIASRGDPALDGRIGIEQLVGIQQQLDQQLQALALQRNTLLNGSIAQATQNGVYPFRQAVSSDFDTIHQRAAQFVQSFRAENGINLSDRLWRLDQGAQQNIGQAIELAVVQGRSASQAAQDFIRRGVPVPANLNQQINAARAGNLSRVAADQLMTGQGNPYQNARRVFRTEINRAYNVAYEEAAFEVDDTIGTRFLLSPNHPEHDICDMHASINRYGLGKGVYPKGKNPLPAHPNTISYKEVVFADEVSADDRAGKQKPGEWLKKQSAQRQADVLGSKAKANAFRAGHIPDNAITTPWNKLKRRLERQGINTQNFEQAA